MSTANSKVTSLTGDLTTANGRVTTLTTDLATANGRVTTLTTDLATANGRVTTLTTDLATANARVSSLTTQLTSLNASLIAANTQVNGLTANQTKITYPRHFYTTTELADWLAQDDTNTRYASENLLNRAYILQVRALRDGYLLPAVVRVEGTTKYVSNQAVIGSSLYTIISTNDQYWVETTAPGIPSYPLPLP